MSLSELFSFAISGSAATAVSALVADCVLPNERRGRPRPRPQPRQKDTAPPSSLPVVTRSAAKGLIFFFTYYVAATAQFNAGASGKNTRRAATDAFLVGATASVFTRLFGPSTGPEAPAGHRWSLPALEDDAVLAIDPGLTFCVQEVLARSVGDRLSRRLQQLVQDGIHGLHGLHGLHGVHSSAVVTTLTTFILATTSKAVATGLTYPLRAAAAEATEQRWATRGAAEDEGDVPLIILEDDELAGGSGGSSSNNNNINNSHSNSRAARPHGPRGKPPGKRQHNVLTVLLQMLRAGGVRSLYVGWLRSVVAAALKHGLTMTLQRSLYGYTLRFVLSLMDSQRARTTAVATPTATATATPTTTAAATPATTAAATPTTTTATATATHPVAVPAAMKSPTPTTFTKPEMATPAKAPLPVRPPRQPESQPLEPPQPLDTYPPEPVFDDARSKVQSAVESWLDSSTAVSDSTVQVEDSVSNISARPRRPAAPFQGQIQRREMALARYNGSRHPREVAGLAASRASEPTAFYPDAATAGRRQPPPSAMASHDFADDDGSLIFNMVSKSPRVIKGRRERL